MGLGKTIEAALIARELLLRKKVREIVVSCPPSMLLQWQDELETRFGLVFEILDKDYMQRVRRERGFGVNPWSTHSRFLVSHRLLIDEAYAGPLRDWLGDFRPGTLLILDEAHHAAPSSGQKYAIDSKITRAIRDLAPRFEHRLFLSATPHNGHSNSFSALLEILDPQRFCRGVPADKKLLNDVMVRRLKEDLRETGIGGFPQRRRRADRHRRPARRRPRAASCRSPGRIPPASRGTLERRDKRKQAAAGLLITGLQQRLLSSIEAFARTLRVHRRTVQRHWERIAGDGCEVRSPRNPRSTCSPMHSAATTTGPRCPRRSFKPRKTPRSRRSTAATTPTDRKGASKLFAREQQLLDQMTEIAEAARACPMPACAS